MDLLTLSFDIISCAGTAKALSYEALESVEKGDYIESTNKLKEADEEFKRAHDIQTELIAKEASGEKFEIPITFIHAQDHLSSALDARYLVECLIRLHKKIDSINKKSK